jgi:prophage tail gpP-like protein
MLNNDGSFRNLQGWSFTVDLVDSTLKSSYEKNDMTLWQIAEEVVRPFGIEVNFNSDPGGKFDRVTANESETVARFLIRLARQRSLLITSTPGGNLLFTKTTSNKNPVDIIEEGGVIVNDFNIKFDGRKRFNSYAAIGQSPLGNKKGIAKDNKVPRSRFLTFRANETILGDVDKAAKWKRNGAIAESLTIPIPVIGWFDSSNNLWRENTIVTVKSKSMYIPDGHDFLIRAVEYIELKDRQTSILHLVPPEVYTEDEIIEPWSV